MHYSMLNQNTNNSFYHNFSLTQPIALSCMVTVNGQFLIMLKHQFFHIKVKQFTSTEKKLNCNILHVGLEKSFPIVLH